MLGRAVFLTHSLRAAQLLCGSPCARPGAKVPRGTVLGRHVPSLGTVGGPAAPLGSSPLYLARPDQE